MGMRQIASPSNLGHRQDLELGEAALGAIGILLVTTLLSNRPGSRDAEWPAGETRGGCAGQHPVGPPFPQQLPPGRSWPPCVDHVVDQKIAFLPAHINRSRSRLSATFWTERRFCR